MSLPTLEEACNAVREAHAECGVHISNRKAKQLALELGHQHQLTEQMDAECRADGEAPDYDRLHGDSIGEGNIRTAIKTEARRLARAAMR